MMILPFDKIKKILKSTWPDLTYIWPRDRQYALPPLSELQEALASTEAHTMATVPGFFECDDRSLILMSELLLYRISEFAAGGPQQMEMASWAIGEAVGTFKVSFETHSLLIAVCDDMQIRLIEPLDNQIWIPDSKVDQPFFVDFH